MKAYGAEYEYRGEKRTAFASKEVILSAGALQSPQVLMLSGIGNKAELSALGIPVLKDLPGVGEMLMDHPKAERGVRFRTTRLIRSAMSNPLRTGLEDLRDYSVPENRTGPLTSSPTFLHLFTDTDKDKERPEFYVMFIKFVTPERNCPNVLPGYSGFFSGVSVTISVSQPRSIGRLTLRNADPHSAPLIDVNYFADPSDVDTLRKGLKKIYALKDDEMLREAGFELEYENKSIPGCEGYAMASDDYWNCVIRVQSASSYHQSCTCHMGPPWDPLAVVDPELRVYGVHRLRVVDASVMPRITSGNIMAPTIMIAERAADLMKASWPAR